MDAASSRLREQSGRRSSVERGHDQRAGDVQRLACKDTGRRKLVGAECAVRTGQVEKGALAGSVDEHDGRRGGRRGIAQHALRVEAPLVEQSHDEVAEGVVADLADDGDGEPEPGEPGRRVQRAAAAVERHLVHEGHRSVRQLVDGSRDHVGDEDAETDDVDHG